MTEPFQLSMYTLIIILLILWNIDISNNSVNTCSANFDEFCYFEYSNPSLPVVEAAIKCYLIYFRLL